MLQDVRFALRLLAKDRTFTITAVVTLAICIGANAAMFSIVRSVLLKPLPFPGSDRVVLLYNGYPNAGAPRVGTAVPDYFDRLTAVPALDQQALFRQEGLTFGDEQGAERLTSFRATPSFFRMVGVQPVQGRVFTDAEGEPGKDREALVSYGFWLRKFAGGSVVDRTIKLNGVPYQVVGVMPREFSFLSNDIDIYVPASFPPEEKSDERRHNNNWQMVGRLRQDASVDLVRQQVDALNAHNDERFPHFRQLLKDAGFHTVVVGLQDDVVREVRASLYLLWGGVLFVLLIGCVNLANLVVVRSSGRAREMATRHALGGDLGRLARQLITETTVLSIAGGVLGLLLGRWTLGGVSALSLDQLPRGYEIRLDPVGAAAMLGLTVAVGVVLGLAPVVRLRYINLNVDLREETRGGTAGRRANLVRRLMATAQVAITLVLLVGAGLLMASFRAVTRADLGFRPAGVETASVTLPASAYKDDAALIAFEERALAAIRALPEVEAAGTTSVVPFGGNINNSVILGEGHIMKPGESLIAPTIVTVSAGYFEAMGASLARGRVFDRRDTKDAPRTVVIDERLARAFWPGQDAVGRRMYRPTDPKDITKITAETQFYNVVGVIREMQFLDPRGDFKPVGVVFFPYEQDPGRGLVFAVKARTAAPLAGAIRSAVAGIDREVPVYRSRSMDEWIDRALVGRRVPMLIAAAFAAVALLLSSIGVYGVLAYGVVQRRRELGVRLALGGTSGSIFGLVLADGIKIVGAGLVSGIAGSYAVGRLMQAQLFQVTATDPTVLLTVTITLSAVGLLASLIPARRASKIDPIVVLSR